MQTISQARVRSLFSYDPTNSLALRWRNPPKMANRCKVGSIAGRWKRVRSTSETRQRYVSITGRLYTAQLLVWIYWHGATKLSRRRQIVFKTGDTTDFRIENLAELPAIKERLKRYRLRAFHDLTLEEWTAIFDRQGGVCAICHRAETMVKNEILHSLALDHDHATGAVRGLLCVNCNNGLGRFDDDPARLRAAAEYIERHRSPSTSGGSG